MTFTRILFGALFLACVGLVSVRGFPYRQVGSASTGDCDVCASTAVPNGYFGQSDTDAVAASRNSAIQYMSSFTFTSTGAFNFAHVEVSSNTGNTFISFYKFLDNSTTTLQLVAFGSGTQSGNNVTLHVALNQQIVVTSTAAKYGMGFLANDAAWTLNIANETNACRWSFIHTYSTAGPPAITTVDNGTLVCGSAWAGSVNNLAATR